MAGHGVLTYDDFLGQEEQIDKSVCGQSLEEPFRSRLADDGAHDPTPTPYFVLEELFEYFELDERSHLLDVGCATGRVLAYFLHAGLPGRITGIELDPWLASFAQSWTAKKSRVEVLPGSVLDLNLSPYTGFYLFNPFDQGVLQQFIEQVEAECRKNDAAIASIVGRFYAMDRDKRWERVQQGYALLVKGEGKQATDMVQAMQESYDEGVTDEFIKPIHNAAVNGCIEEGDVVIFINFRNDRAKELTIVLTQQDMPEQGMMRIPGLQYYCMTPYDASFQGVHILFPKENVEDTLGEYLSRQGKRQLHTAETEKYAHVTFFFNGGREKPFEGEDRILVASPKVATYDLKPEMSAYEVKDKLCAAIRTQQYDFIVVNFANGDMVGHTGVYNAIAKAVWAVDNCVREVIEAAKANDYEAIIIADHGNADNAINPDGTPNTAHSLNPVPFIYVTDNNSATVRDGRLADVAPSILHIMGLEQPKDMTGENLISD